MFMVEVYTMMDEWFDTNSPHKVFWTIEKRDEVMQQTQAMHALAHRHGGKVTHVDIDQVMSPDEGRSHVRTRNIGAVFPTVAKLRQFIVELPDDFFVFDADAGDTSIYYVGEHYDGLPSELERVQNTVERRQERPTDVPTSTLPRVNYEFKYHMKRRN